jgi:S-adenosylmethionine:tRNA ribosyltransferase-isomerase
MRVSEFDYELPETLIAQHPLEERDASRMLVLSRNQREWHDGHFRQFPSYLRKGDVVVINNTRVFPARLVGEREPSGGRIELFLIEEREDGIWEVLARPAKKLPKGSHVRFPGARLTAEVAEAAGAGKCLVRFRSAGTLDEALAEIGQTPLPPYIKRSEGVLREDRERYQTVYARHRGAIAAPTAGLHFTPRVMAEIAARGAHMAEITLHVGYATFEPVHVTDISEHMVAPEHSEITDDAARIINAARAENGRIIAVGTTTVRALESAVDDDGLVTSGRRAARLTIVPGYVFRVVEALVTNFHLPRSSLLLLVSAFAGRDLILSAYRHAIRQQYRFYSYGDCMLII